MRLIAVLIVSVVGVLVGGCGRMHMNTGASIPPGGDARVVLVGSGVYVEVENIGPGDITYRFENREGAPYDRGVLEPGRTWGRSFGEHHSIVLTNPGSAATVFGLMARGRDGTSVEVGIGGATTVADGG